MDFSSKKNPNPDLHFFDNGDFAFRNMETSEKFIVQKIDGHIIKAWPLIFKLRFRFDGIKNITAGMYSLTHDHDAVYDPFGQAGDAFQVGDGPNAKQLLKKGGGPVQSLITRTAENTCNKHAKGKKKNATYDKAFLLFGFIIVILGIALFIKAVT